MISITSKQKRWLLFLQIIISVAALLYVIYKIVIFEHWNAFFSWINEHFLLFKWLIVIQLALSFLNISLETLKWRLLTSLLERLTFFETMRQVLYGILIGTITPAKLGEPFGKAMFLKKGNRSQGIILSFTGSIFQNIIIMIFGIKAFFVLQNYFFRFGGLFHELQEKMLLYVLLPITILISLFFVTYKFFLSKKKKLILNRMGLFLGIIKKIDRIKLAKLLLFTLLRYITFSFQLWIILKIFNIFDSSLQFWLIPLYYLIVTFLPTMMLADLGVRGSAALLVFGMASQNSAAILCAIFIIWFFNVALPAISNLFLKLESPTKSHFDLPQRSQSAKLDWQVFEDTH